MTVHVDDKMVAGPRDEIDKLLLMLAEDFTTNDLGELSLWDLRLRMTWRGISLASFRLPSLRLFASRFDVTTLSLFLTFPGADLGVRMEGESGGTWVYREAVGGLLWLTVMSRPDIANAVRVVARHSHNQTAWHWKAVLMIIEYLLGTKDLDLMFERGSGLNLPVFTDANYAEKADDRRRYVTAVAVTLGNSVVSWVSSTQRLSISQPPRSNT